MSDAPKRTAEVAHWPNMGRRWMKALGYRSALVLVHGCPEKSHLYAFSIEAIAVVEVEQNHVEFSGVSSAFQRSLRGEVVEGGGGCRENAVCEVMRRVEADMILFDWKELVSITDVISLI